MPRFYLAKTLIADTYLTLNSHAKLITHSILAYIKEIILCQENSFISIRCIVGRRFPSCVSANGIPVKTVIIAVVTFLLLVMSLVTTVWPRFIYLCSPG